MEEPKIYLLAQFDENTQQKLDVIYHNLVSAGLIGKQTPEIPYHFTLGSFETKDEERIIGRVREACKKTSAFCVRLSHIGLFGMGVLFIAPSMNEELMNLFRLFVPEQPTSGCHNWVAHATLLIDEPEKIQAAIPFAAKIFSPFNARIESIGIYKFFPKRFIASYRLNP